MMEMDFGLKKIRKDENEELEKKVEKAIFNGAQSSRAI